MMMALQSVAASGALDGVQTCDITSSLNPDASATEPCRADTRYLPPQSLLPLFVLVLTFRFVLRNDFVHLSASPHLAIRSREACQAKKGEFLQATWDIFACHQLPCSLQQR